MPCLPCGVFSPSLLCRLFCRVFGVHGEGNIENSHSSSPSKFPLAELNTLRHFPLQGQV